MASLYKYLLLWILLGLSAISYGQDCNIFIHGYTNDSEAYFGELPNQVQWNSSEPVEFSAPRVAHKILNQMNLCPKGSRMVLRPHSYGAAQVQYILSKGRKFQGLFPDHVFVEVYRQTHSVYAYTGAYHGTPIMDLVCTNFLTRALGKKFGRSCVPTLTTSKIENIVNLAPNPGVPTHLITSSNRSGYYGSIGFYLAKHKVDWMDFIFRGVRNQNDNTLPLYATKACLKKKVLKNKDTFCRKMDHHYINDFFHETRYNHTALLKDEELLLRSADYE